MLEKIVLQQLKDHLSGNDLIESFQSAYKSKHSTETALLRIINDLLNATDDGMVSILALLDLSAAFDTIDHSILVRRLAETFGLSGTVLDWFKSYLDERTQFVVIDGIESKKIPLQYGVPQGSVLGPVLYTMYTQPLGDVIKESNLNYHMYADDTQLYQCASLYHIDTLAESVQSCIENVQAWMSANKLKMNDEKTEIIPCTTKPKLKKLELDHINVGNTRIDFSFKAKNLGLNLDSALSMDVHINHLCKVLNFELRKLSQIRQYLDINATKTLASAFILSRLDYCNSVFAGLPQVGLQKLQLIQNRAARLILKEPKRAHVTPMLRRLHWLPVNARIEYKLATMCFQCLHCEYPSYLKELVSSYKPSRELRSRNLNLLCIPKPKISYGNRAFSFAGPHIWNDLPMNLRSLDSFDTFKRQLKSHLFYKYL